jgi:surface protein
MRFHAFCCIIFLPYEPSFLATVFSFCYEFNGDLKQWDVAKVTDMSGSKSIRIVENDLT